MRESEIWKRCLLAVSNIRGLRIFRNNVGTGWVGKTIRVKKGQRFICPDDGIFILNPRPLQAGLVKGSADGIGWKTVVVTPEMVGKSIAVFVSMETKTSAGRLTNEQATWARNVKEAGGVAFVARSPEDLINEFNQRI